jgi:hypothetical protein
MKTPEHNEEPQQNENGRPEVLGRREFLGKSVGAAAIGATIIGGGKLAAQEADKANPFGTPDWKTLKPGAKDSGNYAEQTGYGEESLTWWPGRNVSGVTIGLIQFRANLAMMPGNMGNATTFDFPMLYREMNADNVLDVMSDPPSQNFLEGALEAARWLELQGVRAIMGNCGFWGNYQKVVKEKINTPFFSSSLIQLPQMVASMPGNKKIGVLTANGPLLQKVSAIENCGLSAEDKANRIVIEGCENDKAFSTAMACDGTPYNPQAIEKDILAATKRLLKKDKDIGAILLECTELSPHAVAVQNLVHMPVWDYTTLTKWIYSGCVRRPFVGHV